MTPDDVREIVKTLLAVDWQLAVGLALAVLWFPIGAWLLLKRPPPRDDEQPDALMDIYRRWRVPLVGVTFILLGSWAAGGAEMIASRIWGIVFFTLFVYLVVRAVRLLRWWFKGMPVAGQVYTIKGIGEVEVIATDTDTIGMLPVDSSVRYRDTAGNVHTVHTIQFRVQTRGTLQEDRELMPVTEIEEKP